MKSIQIGIFLLLLLSLTSFCQAQDHEKAFLKPIDESAKDCSFAIFENSLFKAIEKKDFDFIYSIVSEKIKVSFGGGFGKEDFVEYWELRSKESEFWKEMKNCLLLGVTQEEGDGGFSAPYVYSKWPDKYDPFTFVATIQPKVELKSKPDKAAKTIRILEYEIINFGMPYNEEWAEVKTLGGTKGYILQSECRSPIDYRAIFTKENGEWRLFRFIAGD